MKGLFQLVFCSYLSTHVLANCPPKEPEVAQNFKQNWSQFLLRSPNPEQKKGPTPARSDAYRKDQLDNYFLNPLPEYEAFNKWFFKALDNGTQSVYEAIKESYVDSTFQPPTQLTNTPFPIPAQFQRVYSWLQKKNPALNVPMDNVERKKKIDSYFGGTIKPIFEGFYEWLYDKQNEDEDWKQHFEDSRKLRPPRFRDMGGTPFPVPKKFHVYYYYEMMHPNSTANQRNQSISSGDPALDRKNMEKIVNEYFGFTPPPGYEDFYHWFYDKQHEDDDWLRELTLAQRLSWPNTSYQGFVVPFSIPPEYVSYYILSEASSNETSDALYPTDSPTDLDKLLDEANLFGDYEEFKNWLGEASPFRRNVLKKACELTQKYPINTNMTTPFLVPEPLRDAFCWVISNDEDDDTTDDSVEELYREQLEEYFNKPILPIHDLFYQWLYDALNDEERVKARDATDEPIKLDFNKWLRFTPFPVPAEHLHDFAYINALESFLNISTKPPRSQKKSGQSTTKARSNIGGCNIKARTGIAPITVKIRTGPPESYAKAETGTQNTKAKTGTPENTQARTGTPESNTKAGTDIRTTQPYDQYIQWINRIFKNDPKLLSAKMREYQLDFKFNLKDISTSTPFPVPPHQVKFYHWLNAQLNKKSTLARSASSVAKKTDFAQWLNKIFNNDQAELAKKLRECQADHAFQIRNIQVTPPFNVPLQYFRFYHWINSQLNPQDYVTQESPDSPPPSQHNKETASTTPPASRVKFHTEPPRIRSKTKSETDDEDEGPPPTTPSYLEFTKWLNQVLDHKRDLITQKIKECQHDQDFNPKAINESTPFPVPIRYYRFYHWLNSKVKAGEHKKDGIIHTAPPKRYETSGKPAVSFLSTQVFPEYTKWLFDLFKNDPKLVNEKLKECQQDPTFDPRAIKVSTPFPIPIRHFRLFHWINSKLKPDEYKYSKDEITHPSPLALEPTYSRVTEYDSAETTKLAESTTDAPVPPTKSYLEFTKWLNKILDDKAELIAQKMKECQHDQEFNPRHINETTPFPVPINHFRFYHWLNSKYKAGEHKKQGIIHTAPAIRHSTSGKPAVSFMTTEAHPEFSQWLFDLFKNDQKLINQKLEECRQDQNFHLKDDNKTNTSPFPIPVRFYRFYHWMNSKLESQQSSKTISSISRPSTVQIINNSSSWKEPGQVDWEERMKAMKENLSTFMWPSVNKTISAINRHSTVYPVNNSSSWKQPGQEDWDERMKAMRENLKKFTKKGEKF